MTGLMQTELDPPDPSEEAGNKSCRGGRWRTEALGDG